MCGGFGKELWVAWVVSHMAGFSQDPRRLEVFDEGSKGNVVHSVRILDEATLMNPIFH